MEEFKLIRLAVKGDVSAFEKLIIPYEKKVYNIALGICKNEEDARDVSQEVFIKVYRKLDSFSFNSTFSTWIYTITRNTTLDYLRKESKRRNATVSEDKIEMLEDGEKKPLDKIISDENVAFLKKYMAKLNDDDRVILTFREIDGHSYEELSKVFGLKVGTVKSKIFRAKKKLRKLIEDDMEQNRDFFV